MRTRAKGENRMRKLMVESLEDRRLLAADLGLDINNDGHVSPVDALIVINAINSVDAEPVVSIPEDSNHLFILSGQSNMAGMALGHFTTHTNSWAEDNNVNVDHIKVNKGGRPIAEWYNVNTDSPVGYLNQILSQIPNTEYDSVTLLWMQGEADARRGTPISNYDEAFTGMLDELSEATGNEVESVVGRLSDFSDSRWNMDTWNALREYQMEGRWVSTDDLNDFPSSPNDLHYTNEGYRILGERFAEEAIDIIAEVNTVTPEQTLNDDYSPIDSYFANSPDVNGDGIVSPIDALIIINEVNRGVE